MHDGLAWLADSPGGAEWLEGLRSGRAAGGRRWSLRLGGSFDRALESLAVPAGGAEGTRAVLKVAFRGRENEHEAAALAHWDGNGAVALLDYDPASNALLL